MVLRLGQDHYPTDLNERIADQILVASSEKSREGALHIKTNYYQKLLQIADQILVEASEQSRLGAGE